MSTIWVLSCSARRIPQPARFLSDTSYSIYLFHLFFMYEAQSLFPLPRHSIPPEAILVPWGIGSLGPLALIWLGLSRRFRTSVSPEFPMRLARLRKKSTLGDLFC